MSLIIGSVLVILLILNFYLFPRATIYGDSMYPTLKEGQVVRCSRPHIWFSDFKEGAIYVYQSPNNDCLVIKRLVRVGDNPPRTKFWFLGDNLRVSVDSREYGYVSRDALVGKVLLKQK